MRRFYAGILVLALVLWETGCGHNPEFKPEPTAYSFSDEEKLSFVGGKMPPITSLRRASAATITTPKTAPPR